MLVRGMYVAGRYEIVGKIGTGGMSDVYKAMDHTLGRYVAVKVLKQEFSADMTFVTKFRTEAQSAAGLEHPNIVNVYDVGSENGFYYIVMEYVEGITLKTYIEKKGRLNYKETLSIAIQVSRGIQAAHAKNIIHRDIKPQNIIISTDGKVKVTDFGIARAVSENTIHSDVMGSVHYVSPEQARNGYVSVRSDIYSLGIVMYEMVTGRVPFDGDSPVSIAIQHLQEEIVDPSAYAPDLPISLEKIILKCTQKSPDKRYPDMDNLLIDLRKSLLSPNEDFVSMIPTPEGKTRVLSNEEMRELQERAAGIRSDEDEYDGDEYEDEYDEEEEGGFLNSRMERIVSIMKIVVAIVIVILVIYFVGSFLGVFHFGFGNKKDKNPVSAETETVKMIDLKGMTMDEAREKLEDMGLSIRQTKTATSDQYEEGQIMEQSVAADETVKAGTTIEVTVSSGKEAKEAEVPDVVGDESDSAMTVLEDAGFVPEREFEYDEDTAPGKVIRQSPKGGEKLMTGETVTIYVSQGTESVKVPSVVGKTEKEAKQALSDAGLKCEVSNENSDSVEKGKVVSQSSEGKYVDKGTTIKIVVSSGPKSSSYYYSANIKAPSNVTVISADIELLMPESDEVIKSWYGVTSFPYKIEVSDIKDVANGTLSIEWHYKDANGTEQVDVQSKDVSFKKNN